MTASEYIRISKEKYPKLFAAKMIEITPDALESVMRQAFAAGWKGAKEYDTAGLNIFDGIFGQSHGGN